MSNYSTNLTDKQWQVIEKIINPQERQRKHKLVQQTKHPKGDLVTISHLNLVNGEKTVWNIFYLIK